MKQKKKEDKKTETPKTRKAYKDKDEIKPEADLADEGSIESLGDLVDEDGFEAECDFGDEEVEADDHVAGKCVGSEFPMSINQDTVHGRILLEPTSYSKLVELLEKLRRDSEGDGTTTDDDRIVLNDPFDRFDILNSCVRSGPGNITAKTFGTSVFDLIDTDGDLRNAGITELKSRSNVSDRKGMLSVLTHMALISPSSIHDSFILEAAINEGCKVDAAWMYATGTGTDFDPSRALDLLGEADWDYAPIYRGLNNCDIAARLQPFLSGLLEFDDDYNESYLEKLMGRLIETDGMEREFYLQGLIVYLQEYGCIDAAYDLMAICKEKEVPDDVRSELCDLIKRLISVQDRSYKENNDCCEKIEKLLSFYEDTLPDCSVSTYSSSSFITDTRVRIPCKISDRATSRNLKERLEALSVFSPGNIIRNWILDCRDICPILRNLDGISGIRSVLYDGLEDVQDDDILTRAYNGDDDAQFELSLIETENYNDKAALKWLNMSARGGNPKAQFNMYHLISSDPEFNLQEAIGWLFASAGGMDDRACDLLGYLYHNGSIPLTKGTEKPESCGCDADTLKKSILWTWLSAIQGNAHAQYIMGIHCIEGDFGDIDLTNGIRWLSKSAESYPEALTVLGNLTVTRYPYTEDLLQSLLFFEAAEKEGSVSGKNNRIALGLSQMVDSYDRQIRLELEKNSTEGNLESAHNIANLIIRTSSGSRDFSAALGYLRDAADKGCAESAYMLGQMYKSGNSYLGKDVKEARRWFEKGAEKNSIPCLRELLSMCSEHPGAEGLVKTDILEKCARIGDLKSICELGVEYEKAGNQSKRDSMMEKSGRYGYPKAIQSLSNLGISVRSAYETKNFGRYGILEPVCVYTGSGKRKFTPLEEYSERSGLNGYALTEPSFTPPALGMYVRE